MRKVKSTGIFFAFLLIFVGGVWLWTFPLSYAQEGGVFTSPLVTPTTLEGNNPFGSFPPPPTSTPTPSPSAVGQRALQYVADHNKISVTDLIVVGEHRRDYPLTGQSFQAVTLLDRKTNRVFKLLVDSEGKTVLEDVTAVEQMERDAHQVKYGKMEPRLYEQLQTMKDDEMVDVAIWMVGVSKRSREERYADLATEYPEAEEALNRSGKPMDVGDYDLINKIEAEYVKLLNEDTQGQIQPLARYLEERGYKVTIFEALPVIAVTLPKQVIQEISLRIDVDVIYLDDKKETPAMSSAAPTNRVPSVWQSGFEGGGINIGILETGKIDFTSPTVGHNWLHQGIIRPGCTGAESGHKTQVSSSAASYHPVYMGMAPEATIVDACTDGTSTDIVTGLAWATNQADPINFSAAIEYGTSVDLQWFDRVFDYWAHSGNDTIVVVAGNEPDQPVDSPGKGWNVITVGAINDNGTSNWSDDVIWDEGGIDNGSSWINPAGYNREKPEVVAPGQNIKAIRLNNTPTERSGTSYAAPQVAGLAALLMDQNADLAAWPEAVKAIIMASAVHNITGPANGLAPGQDLKDGAGAIDAALADSIAKTRQTSATTPCTGPCWWGIGINNTNFPLLTWLYRDFTASQGERIRVAISWWSNADCPDQNSCDYDRLDTDLDLHILDPDGQTVVTSTSWDNNYEMVDFVASKTGQYTIVVQKYRAEEYSNFLGIAWVKDATYLPDVMANWDGWQSTIDVRNDGATETTPIITFYDTAGTSYGPYPPPGGPIAPNGVWTFPLTSGQFNGSAIVSGSEDLSVMVRNTSSSKAYAYVGVKPDGSSGNPGWGVVGQEAYIPVTSHNYGGWVSYIAIQNTASAQASVTVTFEGKSPRYYTIPANGVKILDAAIWGSWEATTPAL